MEKFQVSERRACELNAVDRTSYRYEPRPDRNRDLRQKLSELARRKPRYGYRRLGVLLERDGESVNHKRLWRVYQQAGLGVRRRERKRLERGKVGMPLLMRPNQEWSIDFISDAIANGRAIRALTVIDGFTKESPVIEVDASAVGTADHKGPGWGDRAARATRRSPFGQWPGVHKPLFPGVGRTARNPARIHPTRQACAEQLHRELQRPIPR
jgi:putative transposase